MDGTVNSGKPTEILEFSCTGPVIKPYTLAHLANAGVTIDLKVKWASRSRLELSYGGKDEVNFQVAGIAGIDVSLVDASKSEN
jgi:hypothetical protein